MAAPSSDTPIYLDHAAATPLRPEVVEAMREAEAIFANPSSPHAAGRRARATLEDARERILDLLGGRSAGRHRDRLVFTSGATEANRLGILGTAGTSPGIVAISPRDHGSLVAAAHELAARGWRLVERGLARDGTAMPQALDVVSGERCRVVVSSTLVCSQTGIRETPVAPASALSGQLCLHADATQAIGWDAVSFLALPVTSLAAAATKIGGPRGVGALLVRGDVEVTPLVPGPQELGLRGGTEPVPLAVGFATALALAVAERDAARLLVTRLRDRFEERFVAVARHHGFESLVVGQACNRAAHVSALAVRGCDRQALVMALDLAGVCLATGTACASGSSEPAPAIAALGLDDWIPGSTIRSSLGATTTPHEIDAAIDRIDRVFRRLAATRLHAPPSSG